MFINDLMRMFYVKLHIRSTK